jgi:PmbA protein
MTEKFVEELLEHALQSGASEAEAFLLRGRSTTVQVSDGEVELFREAEDSGVGLRVLTEDLRLGFSYSSELSDSESIAREACENALSATPDEYNGLPGVNGREPLRQDLSQENFAAVPTEGKIENAKKMERAAREFDNRVTKVRQSTYMDSDAEMLVVNSHGLNRGYSGGVCMASVMTVAEEGDNSETGWDFDHSRTFAGIDTPQVGRNAARRAVLLLGARQVKSCSVPVVLDRDVMAELLDVAVSSVRGDNVLKGKSFFADKIGERVAGDAVTIVDDGMCEGGVYLAPIDGEGVANQRTVVVEDGVLCSFLHSFYSARKMGVEPTGNGRRGSLRGVPEVGPTNFYLLPGAEPLEDLISECDKGFYVTEVMGMHTANPISGDISVGAAGQWIEGGKPAFPVRGVTIAGNVEQLLKLIVKVGDDIRFTGHCGAPSVLISEMAISGE